jgi:hypothetical protein
MAETVQTKERNAKATVIADHALAFAMHIGATLTEAPRYWSVHRDTWMTEFVKREGNDLLAGAVSTMAAKIAATSWYVEGPLLLAELARKQLLDWSNFGAGWNKMVTPWVESYLDRDFGGVVEKLRTSRSDVEGPALGYAHLDESKCAPTSDPEWPIEYDNGTKWIKLHRSWVAPIVDMPNTAHRYKGVGFCSVSRTLGTASILMDLVRYKRERLSDLPPAGILLINNLSPEEWGDITDNYDARQRNEGNTTWRDIMTVFGYDPAYPLSAEMLNFSELWENFSEEESTRLAIYSFALGFRTDPREFWPVSAGPLGTATEAEVQARKAKGKGVGIIYTEIEHELNAPSALPEGVTFRFDFDEAEDDLLAADIRDKHTQWIKRLWEPSAATQQGIISTEQAQALLVRHRLVPADVLGLGLDHGRIYNTRYGPHVRAHRDGFVEKRP